LYNDFYKIWVKPGLLFSCETLNLDPGVDTAIMMFSGPSWDQEVGRNDDRELGDYSDYLSYYSTYEGWLYVLVGTAGRLSTAEVENSYYDLRCEKSVPGMPTLTPTPDPPTAAPHATPTVPSSPLPTSTPDTAKLDVRPLTTPTPPSPPGTPELHFVPVDLVVYYDANNDHSPGAGEGVVGLLVIAYDTATGEQIAQGFTDELGSLQFTAAAQGAVRLSISYLGLSQLAGSDGRNV
jgi:hypothetical protein